MFVYITKFALKPNWTKDLVFPKTNHGLFTTISEDDKGDILGN